MFDNFLLDSRPCKIYIVRQWILLYSFFLERERERETSICCYTYACIHQILARTLAGDQTCNPSVWRQLSNQLSYLAGDVVSL